MPDEETSKDGPENWREVIVAIFALITAAIITTSPFWFILLIVWIIAG